MMKNIKFGTLAWQFAIAGALRMDAPATSFAEFLGDAAKTDGPPDRAVGAAKVLGAAFLPDTAAAVTTSVEVSDRVPTSLEEVLAEAEAKKSSLLPWGYDDDTKLLQKKRKCFGLDLMKIFKKKHSNRTDLNVFS
jgi:hypothetical protein